MIRRALAGFFCLATLGAWSARAHFVWVDLKDAADAAQQAELYLSELPEPGE